MSAPDTNDASGTGSARRPKIPLFTSHEMPNATTPTVSRKNSECHESGGSTTLLRATRTMVPTIVQPQILNTTFLIRLAADIGLPGWVMVKRFSEKMARRRNRTHAERRCAVDTYHSPVQASALCSAVGKRATPMMAALAP